MIAVRAHLAIIGASTLFFSALALPEAQARVNEIIITDGAIEPSYMQGNKGQKLEIRVVNRGTKVHNFVLPDFYIFTQNLKPGESSSASFVPDKIGNYPYFSDAGGQPEPGLAGKLSIR